MSEVLPDSRLKNPKATIMVDWSYWEIIGAPFWNGREWVPRRRWRTIKLELEPIYCYRCGKPNGYTPKDLMSFVSWMCARCSIEHGKEDALHNHQDHEFWEKVRQEMILKYGRSLTQEELDNLAHQDRLPNALKLLERESPYRRMQP